MAPGDGECKEGGWMDRWKDDGDGYGGIGRGGGASLSPCTNLCYCLCCTPSVQNLLFLKPFSLFFLSFFSKQPSPTDDGGEVSRQ